MSVAVWPLVAVIGGAAALARFLVDQRVTRRVGGGLPVGTLVVNCSGTLLLGLITGVGLTGDAALVVGTGAIGSYTTFSTWMYETHRLAEEGQLAAATVNVAASLAAGLACAGAGWALGSLL
jgi:fluoride exporter